MGVSGQQHVTAVLNPRERTALPIGKEAGLASNLVWTQRIEEKSFYSTGDRTSVVPSVVRLYNDVATPGSWL
jgi:hypothetical protein